MSQYLSRIEGSPPKGGPVLRTFEKYSGVDGNSVLRILIRNRQVLQRTQIAFSPKKISAENRKKSVNESEAKRPEKPYFKPKIVCRHSSAG